MQFEYSLQKAPLNFKCENKKTYLKIYEKYILKNDFVKIEK